MTRSQTRTAFKFVAYGHPNITATHPTTLEFTTETQLSSQGDCIIGIRATCGAEGLPTEVKEALSSELARAIFKIEIRRQCFEVEGRGSSSLTFQNSKEMVIRRSSFISDRTVLVKADKAAIDIPRQMLALLQSPEQLVEVEIVVT